MGGGGGEAKGGDGKGGEGTESAEHPSINPLRYVMKWYAVDLSPT